MVKGLVSVELKAGGTGFESKVTRWKEEALERFLKLTETSSPFDGLLLVACRCRRQDRGRAWEPPVLQAELWRAGQWQELTATARRKTTKKEKVARRPVKEVLNKLDWYRREGGPKVALAGHFLKEVGKKNHNVGEYAALWNRMLQEDGHTVQLERVRFHAGKSPWVGTRNVFKHIYKFL